MASKPALTNQPTPQNPNRILWQALDWHIMLALMVAILSVYLITYSANIESGDSLQYMDAVSSLARFGDWRLDESLWHRPPLSFGSDEAYPLGALSVDGSLTVILATVLYRLGDLFGLGLVHTVWLFNPLITALTAGLLYGIARAWGFNRGAAALTMLTFGLGTIAWPYSKTFFRDPLAMMTLTLIAWNLSWWRVDVRKRWPFLIGGAGALIPALLAKVSSAVAIPGLIVLFLPLPIIIEKRTIQRALLALLLLLLLIFTAVIYSQPLFDAVAAILNQVGFRTQYTREALHSNLYSLGGSLWGTSPVLLLAILGAWYSFRNNKMQRVWGVVLIVLGYAVGHALLTEQHWFGGLSWPPRFLLPTVPFVVLLCLPVLQRVTMPRRYGYLLLIVLPLAACSLWYQWLGVAVPWDHYSDLLPPQADGLISWLSGLNDPTYVRWTLLRGRWGPIGYDFAWYRADLTAWPIAFGALAAIAVLWAAGVRRLNRRNVAMVVTGVLIVSGGVMTGLALASLHQTDPWFRAQNQALHDTMTVIENEGRAGEIVFVTDDLYHRFIMNENRSEKARFLILPLQPGESPSPQQAAERTSPNPVDLLTIDTMLALNYALENHDRIWLLASNSLATTWARRPIEHYLAQHSYIIRNVPLATDDPTLRLLEIDTTRPPLPRAFIGAEQATSLQFGDAIRLDGFTLPEGESYTAGDVLPISLLWQATQSIDRNYTVVIFLAAQDGYVATQSQDRWPQASFAPTSGWQMGVPVWDHQALQIPPEATPGTYQLWVALYNADTGEVERLPITQGETAQEGSAGILPVTITITAP